MSRVLTTTLPAGESVTLVVDSGTPKSFVVQEETGGGAGYTPDDPTLWPVPAPTTVAEALDILALTKASSHVNAARLPASGEAQSLVSGPFTVVPQKSGVYLALAAVELVGAGAVGGAASVAIRADAAVQGALLSSGYAGGNWTLNVSQLALVTLNRTVSHDWDLTLDTNDAAALAHVEIGRAKLILLEL